jgi:hypothetical protein
MNEHSLGFSLKKVPLVGILPPLSERIPPLVGEEREQALTVKEEVHRLFMPSTRVAPRDYNSRPLYLFIQGTGVFCFYKGFT